MPDWNRERAEDLAGAVSGPATLAHRIITAVPFDYYSSAKEAQAHAENEGIDAKSLTVVGHGGHTKVPRQYPIGLERFIDNAFEALGSDESQSFLHLDRYKITAGRTPSGGGYDQDVDLIVPSHMRSCSVRLRSCDFVQFGLIPRQDFRIPPQEVSSSPLELPLGRNVLGEWTGPESEDRAIRDSLRDWERVLVVGDRAVASYINATLSSFNVEAERAGHLDPQERLLSFGLGAIEDGLDVLVDVG